MKFKEIENKNLNYIHLDIGNLFITTDGCIYMKTVDINQSARATRLSHGTTRIMPANEPVRRIKIIGIDSEQLTYMIED